jgi:hypothetical protein
MRSPFQKELSMNRLSAKPLLAAAIAFGALAAASAAHARSDVFVSIGIQAPYGYVQPAPVYVQHQPVYVQPQPVYVQPEPVYYRHHHQRRWRERGAWGDADHDGVANRYDRRPHNPYRY